MSLIDPSSRENLPGTAQRELELLMPRLLQILSGESEVQTYNGERFSAIGGSWFAFVNRAFTSYSRLGRTLTFNFRVSLSSVVSTPSELRIQLPTGLTVTTPKSATFAYLDNGTAGTGIAKAEAGLSYISLFKNLNSTAWAASTTATAVEGQIELEVKP